MDPISIVIGVVVGVVVGGGIGVTMGKSKAVELQGQIDKLEKEKDTARKQLKSGEDELEKAKKRAEELAAALDKSKSSLKDAQSAKKKHLEEAKKFEKQAKAVESQAKQAESKAKEVESKAKELEKTAAEKAAQVEQLQQDLKNAGSAPTAAYDAVKGDLDGILKVLCEHEEQEAAVIADANGIVVAAFGNSNVKDGMAAAATRITKISDQLKGMVDFAEVSTFRISDAQNNVIAGRTFDVAGEMLALATVGANMPSDGSLDGAMENLSSALGG